MQKIVNFALVILVITILLFTCNTVKHPSYLYPNYSDTSDLGLNGEQTFLAKGENLTLSATRWIHNGEVYYRKISVLSNSDTIFRDSTTAYYTNYGLLPILRLLPNGNTEVLIGFVSDKQFNIDMLRYVFSHEALLLTDTLPMFEGNHLDYDQDGQVEFSGFKGQFPTYCFDCDSDYYRPKLFYEMTPEGMLFDSTATKLWIERTYGVFMGFTPDSTKVIPIQSTKPAN
ncbi:MAG TPA: hypothetical protein PK239_08010 [Chitinophagales bacterium]|nr:hypothetical protein [Chitinophagales bacterium]HRK27220.1 hypothetical protein [Chitinophagales bacterium]